MNAIDDTTNRLTTDNDAEQEVLASLIEPKTVKELSDITNRSPRGVQRIIKTLQERGKARKLSKNERRVSYSGWHPNERIYPLKFWDQHRTDQRIPVYIMIGEVKDVRAEVDDMLKKVTPKNILLILSIIYGRYRWLRPDYSHAEIFEKLLEIYAKVHDDLILSSILDQTGALRGNNNSELLKALDHTLRGDSPEVQLVYLYIREALSKPDNDGVDKVLDSLSKLDQKEVESAVAKFHNLVERGGFSSYFNTRKTKIIDAALKLLEKGIPESIVDQLLDQPS